MRDKNFWIGLNRIRTHTKQEQCISQTSNKWDQEQAQLLPSRWCSTTHSLLILWITQTYQNNQHQQIICTLRNLCLYSPLWYLFSLLSKILFWVTIGVLLQDKTWWQCHLRSPSSKNYTLSLILWLHLLTLNSQNKAQLCTLRHTIGSKVKDKMFLAMNSCKNKWCNLLILITMG